MSRTRLLFCCMSVALLAAASHGYTADGRAGGEFKLKDGSHTVVDAIAFPHHDDIRVVLSDRPLDRAELGEDGTIDNLDFFDAPGVLLELGIEPAAGTLALLNSRSDGRMGMLFASDARLELSRNDAERIAGRVRLGDGPEAHFDLSITRKAERPGQPLPTDGGAPGRALLAYTKAIRSGDLDALIAQASAADAERYRQARAAGETEKVLSAARLFTPSDVVINGGRQDGERAWVDFTGQADGRAVVGIGRMTLQDGRWQLEAIDSRDPD